MLKIVQATVELGQLVKDPQISNFADRDSHVGRTTVHNVIRSLVYLRGSAAYRINMGFGSNTPAFKSSFLHLELWYSIFGARLPGFEFQFLLPHCVPLDMLRDLFVPWFSYL